MHLKRLAVSGTLLAGLFTGIGLTASARHAHHPTSGTASEPVGLSLLFQNSAMAPLTLVGTVPRYLQEIDLVASVPTESDQGIQPLLDHSEFSSLD